MKRVCSLALVYLVCGCMPVHDVPLGSDRIAAPDTGVEMDAAVADAEPMDARSGDHEGSDAAPTDGARTPAPGRDDDDDLGDRARSAGPTLRDAALRSDDAAAPDARRGDGAASDSTTHDDDD
ncbi:MAG: hypothetical protein RLZZ450_5249, partial [Pseudomonadota bacterium]